jgi:hypothetical protein
MESPPGSSPSDDPAQQAPSRNEMDHHQNTPPPTGPRIGRTALTSPLMDHEVEFAVANRLVDKSPAEVRVAIAHRLAQRNALPAIPATESNLLRINEEHAHCTTPGHAEYAVDGAKTCFRQRTTRAILLLARRATGGAA